MALSKKDKKIQYVWQQIEYWLEYRLHTPLQVEVVTRTGLVREHHVFSYTMIQRGQFIVVIDQKHLMDAKTDDLLNIAGREAIRISFYSRGKNINENSPEFIEQLKRYGLPWYSNLPQEGMDLYEYTCLKCQKLIALTPKKLAASKEIAFNPKKLTECCGAMIRESEGKHHYTNYELQQLRDLVGKNL